MGKKRKSIASSLDEVDRTMYASFCSAANSLSQLYAQAMSHQKLSFQAGERHAMEKLYQWILIQQETGSRVTTSDILSYLQSKMDYPRDEPSMSNQIPVPHQQQNHHPQASMHFANTVIPVSSGSSGQAAATAHGPRSEPIDNQNKNNSVFSSALSSPVRRSLQHTYLSQGTTRYTNAGLPPGNLSRTNNDMRDSNPLSSNDSSMDMHQDSPGHESSY
ncbi:hypothetical protein V2J09_017324 [Rumex salicifolius]